MPGEREENLATDVDPLLPRLRRRERRPRLLLVLTGVLVLTVAPKLLI